MTDILNADGIKRTSITIRQSQCLALDVIADEQGHRNRSRVVQEAVDFYLERTRGDRWFFNWLPQAQRERREKLALLQAVQNEEALIA